MPTGLMPKDISAAASPACAMIRVGRLSSSTVFPEPSTNFHGPVEPLPASSVADPQAVNTSAALSMTRVRRTR